MFSYFSKRRLKTHDLNNNRKLRAALHAALLQQQALAADGPRVGNQLEHEIVVTLTSYGQRIHDLYLCIESLLRQSLPPDRIVLWLARSDFPRGRLPELLRRQERRGLEIHFVDEDLGSYKKIVYALERFPHSLLLTVDDDVLYPPDTVEQLYYAWCDAPTVIHCQRAHRMALDTRGGLQPYAKWSAAPAGCAPSALVFPTGVCGVLYFPGSLDAQVLERDAFMRLCPRADDVWLKAMSLKNGVACATVDDPRYWKDRFLTIEGSQAQALKRDNWQARGGNDEALRAVCETYGLLDRLR